MRVLELFAGAGGMALGFHRAGWETAGLVEWDAHAQCVLKARFPGVPLHGDVATFDGAAFVREHGAIDLVSGGSPCQDLSVAGKRAGLEGSRSGLFHEQMRIWEETGAVYCLWENVLGAFSSAKGADFAAVLSAFVGRAVDVPVRGWRGGAGVVAGPAGVAAWRVLDAQFFGVPQRRRRVFVLGARPGGVDPAVVLLEWDRLCGDPPAGSEAGQDAGPAAPDESGGGGRWPARIASTLTCAYATKWGLDDQHVNEGCPLFVTDGQHNAAIAQNLALSLNATNEQPYVIAAPIAPTLPSSGAGVARTGNERTEAEFVIVQPEAVAFAENQRGELRTSDVAPQLSGTGGKPGQGYSAAVHLGRPRRLMPVECCRLMGWPDTWLDVLDPRGKPMADSHRYKMCGNGVASPVAEWIARSLLWAEGLANSVEPCDTARA